MYLNELSNTKSSRARAGRRLLAGAVTLSLVLAVAAAADKLAELQSHFDKEAHAAAKVKLLEKLGEAQFAAATHAQDTGDYGEVGFTFEKYRDNVRAAFELLKVQVPNAEKHSDAYRRLELQARRGIREVKEMQTIVPDVVRPPLQLVEKDLIEMDDALIRLLFPLHTKVPEANGVPPEKKP